MDEFPKIMNLFKRDMDKESPGYGKLIEGQYSCPEFEFLKDNQWDWEEKVDGMNLRVIYNFVGDVVTFKGKTDRAQIPEDLLNYLNRTFTPDKMIYVFPPSENTPGNMAEAIGICLYGEGYGAGIQKGGDYRADKGFILFDVKVGRWWLKRDDVASIAFQLRIPFVPFMCTATIPEAVDLIKMGVMSGLKEDLAEGMVGQPSTLLMCRKGGRVIVKLKHEDWPRG